MQQYKNKNELIEEINKTYDLFVLEFKDVKNDEINIIKNDVDKTPFEMIAYQIGWLTTISNWEKEELLGHEVITPAKGIKWNEIGKLYQQFYDNCKGYSLEKLLKEFDSLKNNMIKMIDDWSEEILFEKDQRKWAYTKAEWPVYKWIHINTVAPFKSFRGKIRKWKKAN